MNISNRFVDLDLNLIWPERVKGRYVYCYSLINNLSSPTLYPHTKTNIQKVEMVQRRAARFTLNRHWNTSSVGEMLHLDKPTLEVKRQHTNLTSSECIPSDSIAEEPVKKAATNLLTAIAELATMAPYMAMFDDPEMTLARK